MSVQVPSSAVYGFTDPEDYTAAFRGSDAQLTITARGQFSARLTWVRLRSLQIQRLSDNLPRVIRAAHVHHRATISFITGACQVWGGIEIDPAQLTLHNLDQDHFQQSFGLAASGFMSLPVEDLIATGAAMTECDLTPPANAVSFRPPAQEIARLRRLHATAGALAERSPEIIANPEAARGLEQALIEAAVGCLVHSRERKNGLAQGRHAVVMRRFRQAVDESAGAPLYIPEICKTIRVSERTLRVCCQEHLGMSPKRYLLLRRMALVRSSLREAVTDTTSVTDIAMRFGFWNLGRFAVEYRALFGETPSATLHQH